MEIRFRDGHPEPASLVLFLPDEDFDACCTSAYDQWCPNSNLFHTADVATAWATRHDVTGEVLSLPEAAERGGQRWRPLTEAQSQSPRPIASSPLPGPERRRRELRA